MRSNKLLAWVNLALQVLNAALLLLDKLLGIHALPAGWEANAWQIHFGIAAALGTLQAFLEKLDANKNGILDIFESTAGGARGQPPTSGGTGGAPT